MMKNWALLLTALIGGAAGSFLSIHPSTTASGHLPRFYRLSFTVDTISALLTPAQAGTVGLNNNVGATAITTGTAGFYTINFAGLTALQQPAVNLDTWVPFIRGITPGAFIGTGAWPLVEPTAAGTTVMGGAGDLFLIATENAGPSTCTALVAFTSTDGKQLTLIDRGRAAIVTDPGVRCIRPWVLWEMEIPAIYLASNPAYAEVLATYTLSWSTTTTGPLSTVEVSVPWQTSSTELLTEALHFHRIVPSSTIQGTQLTSLGVWFSTGRQLVGGTYLSLSVRYQPIAGVLTAAIAGAAPMPTVTAGTQIFLNLGAQTNLPTVSIGVDGCSATPTDIYCCSSSVVSQPANDLGTLRFQLLPQGCVLPAGKLISFTVPQPFLGVNPAVGALPAAAAFQAQPLAIVLNAMLISSTETAGTIESRLGRPIFDTRTAATGATIDVDGMGGARLGGAGAGTIASMNYFTSWAVGGSAVSGFTAVPSSYTTNVVPNTLVLSWVLTTKISLGSPAGATNIPVRFVVTSNPGVFRPNIGTASAQKALAMTPVACNGLATYYTNEYGVLIIQPNPTNVAACYDALNARTTVTFTVPNEALRPNPSGNQAVRFDVRGIPETSLGNPAGAPTVYFSAVDAATLKDQFGYTTTTECNTEAVPSFTFTSPSDISTLSYADRCGLVAKIATLSQGPAAIKQCPLGANGVITWTKVPEGTWKASSWPMTNVAALGTWAQVVGSSPTIAITNWGQMVSYPMFAVTVTYPPIAGSLQSLGINDVVNAGWRLVFVIRNDRLTVSCAAAAVANPWEFSVVTDSPVVAVKHIGGGNAVRAGTEVQTLTGGNWAQRANQVLVIVPNSGVVFAYAAFTPSPVPDDGSDDALFGLLALIAVPVLLCCCLLALLWFLRPKAEACPCVPEYPVQEMYWVNAQPCAPTFAQCGPATTPVYLVQ